MLRPNVRHHLDQSESVPRSKYQHSHLAYSAIKTERTGYVFLPTYSQVLILGEKLVGLASHTITKFLDEDDVDMNRMYAQAAVSVPSDCYIVGT